MEFFQIDFFFKRIELFYIRLMNNNSVTFKCHFLSFTKHKRVVIILCHITVLTILEIILCIVHNLLELKIILIHLT